MPDYRRKLYALLQVPELESWGTQICSQLVCLQGYLGNGPESLDDWWRTGGNIAQAIGASSDRVNLQAQSLEATQACHPISGQKHRLNSQPPKTLDINIDAIKDEPDPKKVFWWFWRFYPELLAQQYPDALLYPAHSILPDCPLHSHQSTVSALVGALSHSGAALPEERVPYLLLFSFSPVQEFIKASRKFVDFWAGSYLLHYLSARLCWHVAQQYGPDAVIVPSLWGQDIIDAFWIQQYRAESINGEVNPDRSREFDEILAQSFDAINDGLEPVERFDPEEHLKYKRSNSLSTAGFPNMITVLVPGKAAAEKLGRDLTHRLTEEWETIGNLVRDDIRKQVIAHLETLNFDALKRFLFKEALPRVFKQVYPDMDSGELEDILDRLREADIQREPLLNQYWREIDNLKRQSCWEWNALWKAQLEHTWEPYWSAVPLGMPGQDLGTQRSRPNPFDPAWIDGQQAIAFSPDELTIPTSEESKLYDQLNIGSWWGSLQERLRIGLQTVKNTRVWQIPAAPGERSSISGQFSAAHPRLKYQGNFREGAGLPESSMRLFWLLMSKVYPGLFNGSERLNTLELTKRMAWKHGQVAESMGIPTPEDDYENLVRFPNLSSIAAARFVQTAPEMAVAYWKRLQYLVREKGGFSQEEQNAFYSRTQRPFHISRADQALRKELAGDANLPKDLNGVMFSSRWLADDMGLQDREQVRQLRSLVDQAHRRSDSFPGFGEGSPSDWWAIVLADGDGMGQYISGKRLKAYRRYVNASKIDKANLDKDNHQSERDHLAHFLKQTDKRMGPATHVGLNRALLDFSNRLVPYLTEERCCGRVIYSGGDDVMAVLPLEDLPGYLLSLKAAWGGQPDPFISPPDGANPALKDKQIEFQHQGGYWQPQFKTEAAKQLLPDRPLFTMGAGATMSMGVVIAHKSIPLPTVLESLWTAEGGRAKRLYKKDGICFRVIYSSGNTLEAVMKGDLLRSWWQWVQRYKDIDEKGNLVGDQLTPVLYRLAEELPQRADLSEHHLFSKAAKVLMARREAQLDIFDDIGPWLNHWEDWALGARQAFKQEVIGYGQSPEKAKALAKDLLGTQPEDLGHLLRFTAFWLDKRVQRLKWASPPSSSAAIDQEVA